MSRFQRYGTHAFCKELIFAFGHIDHIIWKSVVYKGGKDLKLKLQRDPEQRFCTKFQQN